MTTILVIGGAGYIGSHTCRALAASDHTPVVYDNLSRGHAEFVRWGPLVIGDVLDRAALARTFAHYRPNAVIHFAALAYVGESVSDPLSYYKTNVAGMVNVLEAMAEATIDKIVFSSSCAIYGIPDSVPVAEAAAPRPISPYGRSKLMCEQMIRDTAAARELRFVILRYFNAAGADPSGALPERHDPKTHLIPLALDAAMGKAPPLRVFGTDYATRDGTCEPTLYTCPILRPRTLKPSHASTTTCRAPSISAPGGPIPCWTLSGVSNGSSASKCRSFMPHGGPATHPVYLPIRHRRNGISASGPNIQSSKPLSRRRGVRDGFSPMPLVIRAG